MYTKEYFRQQLSDIISPIKKYYNGGKVQYARHSAWYENLSADVEAFARPLWGLVPFWAGGGENETFEKLYITGITSGADKKMTVTGAIATIKTNVLLKWLHLHTV